MSVGEPRRLLELAVCMCRWPTQGEGAEALFCSEPTEPGSSYCPTHRRLSGAKERTPAEAERYAKAALRLADGRQRATAGRR